MNLPEDPVQTLHQHLEDVYQVFSRYPLRVHMEGCPCCVHDADQHRLRSKPISELTSEDLSKYASKAMTTWGDELDFKHFLPRLLELEVKEGRMWSLHSKLNFAQWTSWPEAEQESVRQVLLTRWKLSLLERPEPYETPSLGDLMEAEYDLSSYLEVWEGLNHLHAWGHLSNFVVLYGQAILDGTWEEEHPRKNLQVKRWLIRPEMLDLLQQQFELHLESPFSGMLAEGIDVLSGLLSAADDHK